MISETYRQLLIEKFSKEKLESISGSTNVTNKEVADYVAAALEDLDLTIPQFDSEDYKVEFLENASASKFNNTFDAILQDLRVLYKETINLSQDSINSFERWKVESEWLEKRLQVLEDLIDSMLLLAQDTEGYHSYLVDNLDNLNFIDRSLTDVEVDAASSQAYMKASNSGQERIMLNDLTSDDATFKCRKTTSFINQEYPPNEELKDIFHQQDKGWFTRIITSKVEPITCELMVYLDRDTAIDLTSIYIELADSAISNPMTITPLYSIDNYNYLQLPTASFSQQSRISATFSFPTVQAKCIKFLLTKNGPDVNQVDDTGTYSYEFGFKEISFYDEAVDVSVTQQLITRPLFVTDTDSLPVEFSKLALEACDVQAVDANSKVLTTLNYYVTVSNDSLVPITSTTEWFPLSSIRNPNPLFPLSLDFGDISIVELGVDELIKISYDSSSEDSSYINPGVTFHLLSMDPGSTGDVVDEEITSIIPRYLFTDNYSAILDYQVKDTDYDGSGTGDALAIDENNLVIFRNIGEKGLDFEEADSYVRGVARGWRFKDPYYISVIEIKNSVGTRINVGNETRDSYIILNEGKKVGNVFISTGVHEVKVHKDFWKDVPPQATSLDELKSWDPLYPYNLKFVIEGYDYHADYPSSDEQIYTGVDLFAAYRMKEVGIFDFASNISNTDYKYFALDRDVTDSHADGNSPTRVFIVKINPHNADLQNEHFMIRFNKTNQRFKYLRLRADFTTTDDSCSPVLDSWKIKLGD